MPSPQHGFQADRADLLAALVACSPLALLPDDQRRALLAILAAPLAWSWVEPPGPALLPPMRADLARLAIPADAGRDWLAGLAGQGIEPDALAALEAAGLVEPWPVGSGLAVTLTPGAVRRLAVDLAEFGGDEDPASRWMPADPRPRPIKLARRFGACDQGIINDLVDPALGPDGEAELAEEVSRRRVPTEPVLDPWSGEALVLFAGPDGAAGVPVFRDHRRDHPMKGGPAGGKAPRPKPTPKPAPKPKATPKPKPARSASKAPARSKATPRPKPARPPAKGTRQPSTVPAKGAHQTRPLAARPGGFDLIDRWRAEKAAAAECAAPAEIPG